MKALTVLREAKSGASRAKEAFKLSSLAAIGVFCVGASLYAAPSLVGAVGAAFALTMLAIAIADWRLFIIPDELSLFALALGVVELCLEHGSEAPAAALDAIVRGGTMALLFYSFRFVYRQLRGREGMGFGDVKLAAIAGIWLEWPSLPIVVEIAALGALGFVLSRHILLGRTLDPLAKLPFGAFFGPAIWVCWLLAQRWN